MCEIIARLHAKDPKDRFQSARELADVLAAYEDHIAANSKIADVSHLPFGKRTAARPGRRKWMVAAVVALPLLVLALTEIAGVTHLLRSGRSMAANSSGSVTQPSNVGSTIAPTVMQTPSDVTPPSLNEDPWTVLKPIEMKSEGGATLTQQPDGSILVSGNFPPLDTYTLTFNKLPAHIHAIRLEVLPHSSLPQGGPGRAELGDFALTGIKCRMTSPEKTGGQPLLKIAKASADNWRGPDSQIDFAIDAEDQTAWVTEAGEPHYAVFEFAKSVTAADGTVGLQVSLEFKHADGALTLGCFRLSAAKEVIVISK